MSRVLFGLTSWALFISTAAAANIWLSTTGCPVGGGDPGCAGISSLPPTTAGAITMASQPQATGTLYIWASPTVGKTLQQWSLKLISSNPNVLKFTAADIESYNLQMGITGTPPKPRVRWEFPGVPSSDPAATKELQGLNIFGVDKFGAGIGPGTAPVDIYRTVSGAWLLASLDYQVVGDAGQSAHVYLQIGEVGMRHAEDPSCNPGQTTGCESQLTNVTFGLTTDAPLNAKTQRGVNSATPDFIVNVAANQPGDFDGDGDVDGRDFLAWQRNPSKGPLADWHANFGSGHVTSPVTVPEPGTGLAAAVVGLLSYCQQRRGRGR